MRVIAPAPRPRGVYEYFGGVGLITQLQLDGEVRINGALVSNQVLVYMPSDGGLVVNEVGPARRALNIYTFNTQMTNALSHDLMKSPIEYFMAGTRLGSYSQQFGWPADADSDFRPIKRLGITITHDRNFAYYEIEGLASGTEGYVAAERGEPVDWLFDVRFRVPRKSIARLYGLGESAKGCMLEAMDACGAAQPAVQGDGPAFGGPAP